ncbi:MAG: DUF2141 domain-containing protein [Myxococcota bacterium]
MKTNTNTKERTWMTLALCAALSTTAVANAQEGEGEGELKVQVQNIQSDKGQIGCSLWKGEEGFPSDSEDALQSLFIKPKGKKATCVFKNVKPGTYAVSVMHDIDNDGELDSNLVGRPKEPWAVSNNAPAERFGPPKFDAAKFSYSGASSTIQVKLTL